MGNSFRKVLHQQFARQHAPGVRFDFEMLDTLRASGQVARLDFVASCVQQAETFEIDWYMKMNSPMGFERRYTTKLLQCDGQVFKEPRRLSWRWC